MFAFNLTLYLSNWPYIHYFRYGRHSDVPALLPVDRNNCEVRLPDKFHPDDKAGTLPEKTTRLPDGFHISETLP